MSTGRLWRLTRNEYGRRVYEALANHGVKVSMMYVYARSLDEEGEGESEDVSDPVDESITLETWRGSDFDRVSEAFEELDPTDIAVVAREGEAVVGRVFSNVSRPVYADPVEMDVGTDGAYIWQLHVDRSYRQRGIGTALVDRVCRAVARESELSPVTALVAVDNIPSQRLFERNGFERRSLIIYGCVFGIEHRSQRAIADDRNTVLGV